MDAHPPRREDDLSEFERRLAGWRPAPGEAGTDAVLYAAGFAAGRGRGRWLWPAVCGLLLVQVIGLGAWGLTERAERLALAARLREPVPDSVVPLPPDGAEPSYPPPPDGYFLLRQRMEQDPNRWLASPPPTGVKADGPPPPQPAILRGGQRDVLIDP